jgi:hypothetical protein
MYSRFIRAVVLTTSLPVISGCGGGGSTVTPPPTVVNAAPTIESLAAASERIEADRSVQLTAVIKDTVSQLSQMTYTWSATPQSGAFGGVTSFSGSQATNTWKAPKAQLSPNLYTLMLTVTESFTSAGQPKQNSVSKTTTVHYNDSPEEVKALGRDFLVTKFGTFEVTPAQAVSNFSDSCPGKAAELHDIEDNRANFHILSASFLPDTPTFNTELTAGEVKGSCQFEDRPNTGPNAGHRQFVSGICTLKTIYENFKWYLCDSTFEGTGTTVESLRGRVPGRLVRR